MPLLMPMIPVLLKLAFKLNDQDHLFVSGEHDAEIPLPECEIEICAGGHPYIVRQVRRWDQVKMWVTLIPIEGQDLPGLLKDLTEENGRWWTRL